LFQLVVNRSVVSVIVAKERFSGQSTLGVGFYQWDELNYFAV